MEDDIVWSDEHGDLRKSKKNKIEDEDVDENKLEILLRRLTSGKGRVVIELTGLPLNKGWCKKFAKDIKKALGVGGAYKNDFIEVHGDHLQKITDLLESKGLRWKKIGG